MYRLGGITLRFAGFIDGIAQLIWKTAKPEYVFKGEWLLALNGTGVDRIISVG